MFFVGSALEFSIGFNVRGFLQYHLQEYAPFSEHIGSIDAELVAEHGTALQKNAAMNAAEDTTAHETFNPLGGVAPPIGSMSTLTNHDDRDQAEIFKGLAKTRLDKSTWVISIEKLSTVAEFKAKLQTCPLLVLFSEDNTVLIFDVNGYGEAVTAPHVRRPPLQRDVVKYLVEGVRDVRAQALKGAAMSGLVAGDFWCVIDGGRESNSFLKDFGFASAKRNRSAASAASADQPRTAAEGKTIHRVLKMSFNESSVKLRKGRTQKTKRTVSALKCTQNIHVFYNGMSEYMEKSHKHFSSLTNASDVLGPFVLPAYTEVPHIEADNRRSFWGKRRVAVGGRTEDFMHVVVHKMFLSILPKTIETITPPAQILKL